MEKFCENIIRLFRKIHPLDRIPRAGYLLRGVTEVESISAHSHFVSLLTLLMVEEYPKLFNKEKALAMALIHDLPEAVTMDIPMPVSDEYMQSAKKKTESAVFAELFKGFDTRYLSWHKEMEEKQSPEAKLVAGLDKVQMMIKVLCYQQEGRGQLEEFWRNPANFRDYGLEPVSRLFDALFETAGCERPVRGENREFF